VDMTDSRLQQTLQKIEKVLRLSDGEAFCFYFLRMMCVVLMVHNDTSPCARLTTPFLICFQTRNRHMFSLDLS
jgi:hypothetical protein